MRWLDQAWYGCFAPADRRPVIKWAAENLRFPHSARSEACDPDTSPWINAPLDAIFDNTKKQVTNIRCTQGSGTTMLEIAMCRIVAEDPGPTLMVCQTDPDATKFKQTRADKTFAATPCIKRLLPWKFSKNRKDAILFDHMPLFIVGANINNLQSDSYRWVLLDEGWRYKPGLDQEAVERTTSQSFARVVRTSQGGYVGDANDQAWKLSTQHEWGFTCPRCRLWQPITFGPQPLGGVRYDEVRDKKGALDLAAIRASVRYECANPECSARWEDNIQDRRRLAMTGSYVQTNPDALPEYVGFHWERTTVYWNAWKDLVTKWVLANESKRRGDTGPLEQFVQKVKGRSWAVEREDFKSAIKLASYVPAAPWADEGEINGVPLRFMTVDVQRDHFWLVIRSWNGRGNSRLRFEHKPVSWEEIRELQKQHGITHNAWVFVDSRHKPDEVFGKCALYGWSAMEGSARATFVHHDGEGKSSLRYYSPVLPIQLGARGRCSLYRVSNLNCKDTLARLRNGDAKSEIQWEVFTGVSTDYLEQMDSESRDDLPGGPHWDNHGRANHLWDCEKMQVGAAYMLKLIGQESVIVPGGQDAVDTPA